MKLGEIVKRRDNGRLVRLLDYRLVGTLVFYYVADVQDDAYTTVLNSTDLRPYTVATPEA